MAKGKNCNETDDSGICLSVSAKHHKILTGSIARHFYNAFAFPSNLPVVEGPNPHSYLD